METRGQGQRLTDEASFGPEFAPQRSTEALLDLAATEYLSKLSSSVWCQ